MTTSYDIKLFGKIRDTYPKSNIKYVPNIIKQKKSGPKQRDINRDTIITGNCLSENCENKFELSFRKVVENDPYCIPCSKKRGNEKRKETKSSEAYKPKLEEASKKRENTCEKKYGNKYALASTASTKQSCTRNNTIK
jgi:hypothetical protein